MLNWDDWIRGFLPDFDVNALDMVEEMYPANDVIKYTKNYTAQTRAGLVYRDVILACPGYWMAASASESGCLCLVFSNESVPGVPPLSSRKKFVITEEGFEQIYLKEPFEKRCAMWRSLAAKVPM